MYIAYLDDSDTKQKTSKWQVMSAVVVKDAKLFELEVRMALTAELLLPPDKLERFTEFHAAELYGGYGVFEGIGQAERLSAISTLLNSLKELKVIYGAVDLVRLGELIYGSADPLDIAFRICAEGVDYWINEQLKARFQESQARHGENANREDLLCDFMAILIADDCDGKSKASIQRSFRNLRKRYRSIDYQSKLRNVHDDMYFGQSKWSLGIQLADLCSYFIAKHLDQDVASEGFYKQIEPHIVYSRIEPKA